MNLRTLFYILESQMKEMLNEVEQGLACRCPEDKVPQLRIDERNNGKKKSKT